MFFLIQLFFKKNTEFRKNIEVGNDFLEIKFVIKDNDVYLGIREAKAGCGRDGQEHSCG